MQFFAAYRYFLVGAACWLGTLGQPTALAQPAVATDRPLLPPAIAQSPALRAFSVAPFANADVRPDEILLTGLFVASTNPQKITIKAVAFEVPSGKSSAIDPPRAKEIELTPDTALWANAQKRESIDWTQVLDYAPIYVIGTDGGAGQPLVARKVTVLDGFIGDLLQDPEFQQRLQQVQNEQAQQETLQKGELPPHAMWLENVGLDPMTTGYGTPQIAQSIERNPLRLGGETYPHGVGTHAESDLLIDLKGKATRFVSMVGVDEEINSRGSVVFSVWVDGRKVAGSSIMRAGDEPELVEADLKGAKTLRLQVSDAGDSANSDHADWAGAMLELTPPTDAANPSSRPSSVSFSNTNIAAPPAPDALQSPDAPPDAIWLESLDLQKMSSGYNRPNAAKSIGNNPLLLGGETYPHGVGTHAPSRFAVDLKGSATRFVALVGVDEEIGPNGSVEFSVWVDGQEMANTGVIKVGQAPQLLSVNLTGASRLELRVGDGGDGINSDHADWAGALLQLVPGTTPSETPVAVDLPDEQ